MHYHYIAPEGYAKYEADNTDTTISDHPCWYLWDAFIHTEIDCFLYLFFSLNNNFSQFSQS